MEWMMAFSVPKALHHAMFDFVLCLWVLGVFSSASTLYSMPYCSQICSWLWAWCHVPHIKANREVTGLCVWPNMCFKVWTKLFPCAFYFFRTRIGIFIFVNVTLIRCSLMAFVVSEWNNSVFYTKPFHHCIDMCMNVLTIQASHLLRIFSAAKCDSAGEPGRRWSADAVLLGPGARVHSLFGNHSALDTPTEDTGRRGETVLHHTSFNSQEQCPTERLPLCHWPGLWAQPSHLLVVWLWRREHLAENAQKWLTSREKTEGTFHKIPNVLGCYVHHSKSCLSYRKTTSIWGKLFILSHWERLWAHSIFSNGKLLPQGGIFCPKFVLMFSHIH